VTATTNKIRPDYLRLFPEFLDGPTCQKALVAGDKVTQVATATP
jgi:hypothetical protein